MSSTMSAAGSAAASSKPSPTANTKPNRLPAPTLFVGPPSRNASQLSISRTATHDSSRQTRDALSRQKSGLSRPFNPDHEASVANGDISRENGTLRPLKKASDKNIEAKWKEMQSTLNEVELTAQSSTHVFGESHAAALDELRKAQVELARAWGRGNENKASGAENDLELNINRFKGAEDLAMDRRDQHRKRADTAASTSTALSDESIRSDSTAKSGRSQLEDETAQDIKLASERRAVNEAYFRKVDSGVKDVVSKLEAVAEAMRGVEGESRSLWSNSDRSSTSLDTQDRREVDDKRTG
ncbi:hypothetical protein CLAFUW4_00755 [Fulvia fulva]|uniref:Uncharacterized protein n=1 Tax=Passalora fulva TaxID=5499 RepID=A0A9Q8P4F0_PASFU|nr:uncharacterized protein CLAFUR5_00758 [Fulvia fulva]KAK4634753.1 hypothetical protein CLAFUR4_00756 [Fulvia fulva]KAK4638311.1 hypothetical protein CLAFUR0_00757 [Fulvia fulva]UJO12913.1 hypothetical protein CLAFUR5_00758 [Fulvia fulva]WPV10370.1 hypothetical protein CLAFUW4_00755 [Fulvia fulva]WPV23623.1 hypothetical protein CLAFUW7_00760 [Fulvia fulva]